MWQREISLEIERQLSGAGSMTSDDRFGRIAARQLLPNRSPIDAKAAVVGNE
jgi:hypothetical protein